MPKRDGQDNDMRQILDERMKELGQYQATWEADAAKETEDAFPLSVGTCALLLCSALWIILSIVGSNWLRWSALVASAGCLPTTIVLMLRDLRFANLQLNSFKKPDAFVRHFLEALVRERHLHAYIMLAPWARTRGRVSRPDLKMPVEYDADEIKDRGSLYEYWSSFLRSGEEAFRLTRIDRCATLEYNASHNLALVNVQLTIFYTPGDGQVSGFTRVIRGVATRLTGKKFRLEFRKLLMFAHGRWFIAESELMGKLDHMESVKAIDHSDAGT